MLGARAGGLPSYGGAQGYGYGAPSRPKKKSGGGAGAAAIWIAGGALLLSASALLWWLLSAHAQLTALREQVSLMEDHLVQEKVGGCLALVGPGPSFGAARGRGGALAGGAGGGGAGGLARGLDGCRGSWLLAPKPRGRPRCRGALFPIPPRTRGSAPRPCWRRSGKGRPAPTRSFSRASNRARARCAAAALPGQFHGAGRAPAAPALPGAGRSAPCGQTPPGPHRPPRRRSRATRPPAPAPSWRPPWAPQVERLRAELGTVQGDLADMRGRLADAQHQCAAPRPSAPGASPEAARPARRRCLTSVEPVTAPASARLRRPQLAPACLPGGTPLSGERACVQGTPLRATHTPCPPPPPHPTPPPPPQDQKPRGDHRL
jgi:hypothetical protein